MGHSILILAKMKMAVTLRMVIVDIVPVVIPNPHYNGCVARTLGFWSSGVPTVPPVLQPRATNGDGGNTGTRFGICIVKVR